VELADARAPLQPSRPGLLEAGQVPLSDHVNGLVKSGNLAASQQRSFGTRLP
jgi:hypothetical protein